MSPPRSSRSTRSDRGGVRSEDFFDVRGLSVSVPELDDPVWLRRGELASQDDPFAGGGCGLGLSGSELCCAHTPKLRPSSKPNTKPGNCHSIFGIFRGARSKRCRKGDNLRKAQPCPVTAAL